MELALRERRCAKAGFDFHHPLFCQRDDWESGMERKLLQLFLENLKAQLCRHDQPLPDVANERRP